MQALAAIFPTSPGFTVVFDGWVSDRQDVSGRLALSLSISSSKARLLEVLCLG